MFNFLRPSGGAQVQRIDAKDAVAQVAAGELILIDVRDGMELRSSGKAAGALHGALDGLVHPHAAVAPKRPVHRQGAALALSARQTRSVCTCGPSANGTRTRSSAMKSTG